MSAVDVIRRRVQKYDLTRPGADAFVDGIGTPGAGTVTEIDAYQQPMTPKELRNLPPGQNAGEWRNVWTEYAVKLKDQIDINGLTFTIQKVALWEDGIFYIANANRAEDALS